MSYFKINDIDFSHCINSLKISDSKNYNSQTNAAGDTVIDYINRKRSIEVGIIALDSEEMSNLLDAIDTINVYISFLNPKTQQIEDGVNCLIPSSQVDYYTIQNNKVMFKQFNLTFTELQEGYNASR